MKKIALIIIIVVCAIAQTFAQPSIHLTPGDGTVTLSGNGGEISTPTHVDVYRGTTNPPNDLYATFAAGYNYTWEDNTVANENFYYYRVKVRDDNSGTESVFSDVDGTLPSTGSSFYYAFDGIDDQVKILDQNFLNNLSTFEFRFKIDELTPGKNTELFRIKFNKFTSTFANQSAITVFHTADVLRVFIRDQRNGTINDYTINTENVADGNWHHFKIRGLQGSHVFAAVDGTDYYQWIHRNGGNYTLYYDGPHDMIVGGRSTASATFLDGAIDDLILTNSSDNIIGQWDFNEPTSESTVFDSGPSNRNMMKEGGVASSTSQFEDILTVSYTDSVAVSWNKDASLPGDPLNYEIYRGVDNGPLSLLASVSNMDTVYVDKSVSNRTVYEYEVRSIRPTVTFNTNTDLAKPAKDFDRYLVADGIGEVQVPDSELFSDNNGTIEFWIRADNGDILPSTSYSVMNKHDEVGSRNGFNFVLDRSNIYVQVKDEASTINVRPNPPVGIVDDQWHHIAFTYEWGGTSRIYVDGQERGSFDNTPNLNLSSEPFRIGKSPATFWTPFIGEIDEVYVWDKILTPTEIADQMNQRVPGDTEGLSGVWRFDLPNSNGVAYDDGVNEFDGTVLGDLANLVEERRHLAASYDGNQVALEWDFVLNSTITSYEILREQPEIPSGPTVLTTLSASENNYSDATAQENTYYEYIIRALTDGNPEFASDNMITSSDLGNMLYFREGGGVAVLTEEVTDNQTGMIEFRFRTDVAPPSGTSYTLLNRHDSPGSDNGFNFVLNENSLRIQFKVDGGDPIDIAHDEGLIDGEWHHVALVYNWNGFNSLVVDGNAAAVGMVSNLSISSEQTRVGSSANSFWAPFEGQIDELRMWSVPRGIADINAAKDIRLPGNTPDLAAVWHFDEPAGIFASDNGPNNYDATLAGDVQFWKEPGRLTFSSTSNGFTESLGNNGFMEGSMQITIEENSFLNAGGVINNNQFTIENEILVATGPTVFEDLTSGLNPVMTVSPDGKTANLIFQGKAAYHINEFSTSSLILSFDPAVFTDDNPVVNGSSANTNISYTLRDNNPPTLDLPIPDYELIIGDGPVEIDLFNHFSDPDFDQNIQFFIQKDNVFISTSIINDILTAGPEGPGDGSTEINILCIDNNGGEIEETFTISVVKVPQSITFNPIDDIDLVDQNTVTLSAIATSGLDVEFELLTGDGSITGNELTVNQTGVFEVEATQPGDDTFAAAEPVVVSFNVIDSRKDDQTITFTDNLSGLTYGDGTITLSGTASSGLEVSYTAEGVVEVNGNTLTIVNAGDARVTAIQSGDENYNPADPVAITFDVEKAPLTATADDQTITFGDDIPTFTVTYDGFLNGDDETDIDVLPGTETIAGSFSDAGTYAIEVGSGNDNNYAFDYVNGTLTIEKADQSIIFNEVGDRDIATSNQIVLQSSASSGLAVSYELQGNGQLLDNVITIERTGTFVVTAFQSGDDNYNAAPSVTQTFLVTNSNKENQTITFEVIPDQEYGDQLTLTATASSGLPVDYNLISGNATVENRVWTLLGIGEYEIQAFQDGDDDFNPAQPVSQQFTVTKATLTATADNQTIQLGESIPTLTFTYAGFKLGEDASSLDTEPTISTTAKAESAAGEYDIELVGGSDDLYEVTLVNGTLTIEALTLSVADEIVTVYPNPVTDRLLVKGSEIMRMQLLSPEGKVVRSLEGNHMVVADLKAGNYLLQLVERDGSVSTHRIIKR